MKLITCYSCLQVESLCAPIRLTSIIFLVNHWRIYNKKGKIWVNSDLIKHTTCCQNTFLCFPVPLISSWPLRSTLWPLQWSRPPHWESRNYSMIFDFNTGLNQPDTFGLFLTSRAVPVQNMPVHCSTSLWLLAATHSNNFKHARHSKGHDDFLKFTEIHPSSEKSIRWTVRKNKEQTDVDSFDLR